jgi:hypothetical protein
MISILANPQCGQVSTDSRMTFSITWVANCLEMEISDNSGAKTPFAYLNFGNRCTSSGENANPFSASSQVPCPFPATSGPPPVYN